ncbi:MAG TPA: hypothetical protein VK932_04010 [Kofleriaceae bacterium]|nr:hypothetical protein [Kofleriaceae bacterium]
MRLFAPILVSSFVLGLFAGACGDNYTIPPDAHRPACSDGLDNDRDGMIDFPDDLGCESRDDETEDSTPAPECSDKRDNDGDGKIDYPNDPGCLLPQSATEDDDCPDGPGCPQCSDRSDNDDNGKADYPGDPGCSSAADALELIDDSVACGTGLQVKHLPLGGRETGMLTTASTSQLTTPCGGGGGAPAVAYVFHVSRPKVLVASTDYLITGVDTVLDLRSLMCDEPTAHVACHDDVSTSPVNRRSKLVRVVQPGTYYLIVQSSSPTEEGLYEVSIDFLGIQGDDCTTSAECGPDLLCRTPVGGTSMVCSPPVCSDGLDDDGDGKIDFPADPGCTSPDDDTEDDVCSTAPTDPACPQCANGLDDDGDGLIDYPDDPTCVSASTKTESCPQTEPLIVATTPQVVGTTAGAVNDFFPPKGSYNGHLCSTTATHTAPDVGIQLDVPALSSLSLKLNPVGFDSSHSLMNASCGGMPIDCHDNPNNMVLSNIAAGTYYLIVDGYSSGSGTFTLNIDGSIVNGESCESALAQSGALKCGAGHACKGAAGSRTCQPADCNDGIDNNGDGKIDYPNDPGCIDISDNVEDTVCPGPLCPACADGADNDGDGLIDYPADPGCISASSISEGCTESDPIVAITTPTTYGTLVGATNDRKPSCVTTNYPDKVFLLDVPTTLQSLVIDTENSVVDTVLSLMDGSCTEPAIACDDDGGVGPGDSLITRVLVPPGTYAISVDSDSSSLNTFELHVKGTILPGGSCESPLFESGVLVCPAGFGCNGAPGSRTCTVAQCQDGIDNNNDGKIDFPSDPGCASPSDATEDSVCPGPACPACADGIDNDGDGDIDYPADSGCAAASDDSEGCVDSDPILAITAPLTTGTLVGATDDHDPQCEDNPGVDLIYTLDVPGTLQSLSIDTEGSVVDTVLSLMDSSCSEPALACDDDGGVGTGDSLITRSFVPPGQYTIAVDADTATPNTFNLNVSGVIVPGGGCESPLVDAGVFTCSVGFACSGPVGARTCNVAQCLDGLDNNGDGKIDFPDDPGCESLSDDSEDTVCPGAACPECSDGLDNDGDGLIDYPLDPSCLAASSAIEACMQSEPIGEITQPITTGTTVGQYNDYVPTCGSTSSHAAPDLAFRVALPPMVMLTLNVTGFDTAHSLLNSTCGGTPIACSDPPNMALTNVPGGTYYVVIDGWSTGNGPWTLKTSGMVAPGGSCEVPLFQSGAFTCSPGHLCAGPLGMRTCTPSQCNDGIDNNGDGTIDFPFDPGCESPYDDSETTVCPGPDCPVCSNMADDDGDMLTDFPADFGCAGAGSTTEVFCAIETTPATAITMPQTAGSLAAPATNDYAQSCQPNTGNDRAYLLQLPVPVATLVVDTLGSSIANTVLSVWDASCTVELGCDDDSAPGTNNRSVLVLPGVAPGNYAIQVDAFGTTTGSFVLNVKGTVAPGTDCTSPLFTTGVLVCPTGTTCTAGTCQ